MAAAFPFPCHVRAAGVTLPQTIPPVSPCVAPLCCDLPSPNPALCRSVRVLCAAVSPSQLGPAPCPEAVGSPAAARPLSLLVLVGKTPSPQPLLATGRWKMSEVLGLPRSAGALGKSIVAACAFGTSVVPVPVV